MCDSRGPPGSFTRETAGGLSAAAADRRNLQHGRQHVDLRQLTLQLARQRVSGRRDAASATPKPEIPGAPDEGRLTLNLGGGRGSRTRLGGVVGPLFLHQGAPLVLATDRWKRELKRVSVCFCWQPCDLQVTYNEAHRCEVHRHTLFQLHHTRFDPLARMLALVRRTGLCKVLEGGTQKNEASAGVQTGVLDKQRWLKAESRRCLH